MFRALVGAVTCALVVACSTTSNPVTVADEDVRRLADSEVQIEEPDTPAHEDTLELAFVDLGSDSEDEVFVPCAPGEGCFLDPCDENTDCLSGWCVDHMGAGVCSQGCSEECPPGWGCKPVGAAEPDLVYVCVSNYANLCRPCGSGESCKSVAGAEDVCVDYGIEGFFCGGGCTSDEDCPWGFSCDEAVTVDGFATQQCVADTGVCPCTAKSVALSLWTPCELTSEFGVCGGKRVCTEEGLAPCDALEPAEEICNGLDDNCSGAIDEESCDDGNPCTEDSCLGEEGCDHLPLDQGECLDNDVCTIGDHCEAGVCLGSPVACDDDNPCTDDACDGLGGCDFTNNTAGCDDGDPCTVSDICFEGDCGGYTISCECLNDSDCKALEDGDICNGTLQCDVSKLPYVCAVIPNTIVECPPATGPDSECLKNTCAPESGTCELLPDHEALACNDGDPCTVGDKCVAGVCGEGVAANCADDNPCTDDSCDPEAGCTYEFNEAPCWDGDACTLDDQCENGTCQSGPEQNCNDGNPCTTDECNPGEGCVHNPSAGPCDDGNACTVGETCTDGQCSSLALLDCDDDDVCTTDACAPVSGCIHTLNQAPCDDGDVCTLGDHCHLGNCISSGELSCEDKNPCTDDSCNTETGCAFVANAQPCDDGEVCTTGDVCSDGACKAGSLTLCDDENPCTSDSCQLGIGCVFTANDLVCDDGDACTTGEFCAAGACGGGKSVVCDDNNICTDDSCHVALGCVFGANAVECNDGNACTTADTCANEECVGGPALPCDDGNLCTDDACDPGSGCVTPPVANGTICGEKLVCQDGSCVPDCAPGSQTFNYTGGIQTFVIPSCGTTLTVDAYGAQGGDSFNHHNSVGGKGGRVQATVTVQSGATLYVTVGEKPTNKAGGYGGAGDGVKDPQQTTWIGAGGGGASDLRLDGQSLGNRILVAAGGGGACPNTPNDYGGVGGGLTGGSGNSNSAGSEGKGATQSAGGVGGTRSGYLPGQQGSAGQGGMAGSNTAGGGGGGGWYGGGGGSWGGGGGGSSWVDANKGSNVTHTSGHNSGHGKIVLSW